MYYFYSKDYSGYEQCYKVSDESLLNDMINLVDTLADPDIPEIESGLDKTALQAIIDEYSVYHKYQVPPRYYKEEEITVEQAEQMGAGKLVELLLK